MKQQLKTGDRGARLYWVPSGNMLHYPRASNNAGWSQSESASEGEDWEPSSRVGEEYQAELPSYRGSVPQPGYRPDDGDLCSPGVALWQPQKCKLTEKEVEQFVSVARKTHSYSTEQALGMLQWHNYNTELALNDMTNFVPFPDEMSTAEDQAMFEEAYSTHGKSFRRIHDILPDKDIGSLIRFYYNWKKCPSGTGAIERRARRAKTGRVSRLEVESGSESDDSSGSNQPQSPEATCRKDPGRPMPGSNSRKQSKPPRGLSLDVAKLTKIATIPGAQLMEQLRQDVAEARRHIQTAKDELRGQEGQLGSGLEGEEPRQSEGRKANKWTAEEVHVALQSLRRHGKDFNAMSALLDNKSAQQCRNFYMNHRRRLNLDRLVAEVSQVDTVAEGSALMEYHVDGNTLHTSEHLIPI